MRKHERKYTQTNKQTNKKKQEDIVTRKEKEREQDLPPSHSPPPKNIISNFYKRYSKGRHGFNIC